MTDSMMSDDELADALEGKAPWTPTRDLEATPSTLTEQEAQSLTMWGEHLSAQVRSFAPLAGGDLVVSVAVHHMARAPRSREDGRPFMLGASDARKLRDLLNHATARGAL